MEAIAFPTPFDSVFKTFGRVLKASDGTFTIDTERGKLAALRATSCLLEPEPGDKVLLIGEPTGALYVLAVLEREAGTPSRIKCDGDLTMDVGEGRFTVAAGEGVDLMTGGDLQLTAARLEVRAGEANFTFGAARLIGKSIDSVLERVAHRVKNSIRWVEGLDQVRSGQLDYHAEGMMRLHGENTVLTANKIVKADGKQVHIG
jgi:hypothetical protein